MMASRRASQHLHELLAENGVTCSMSRSGNVWDNAGMESVFSPLKTERIGGSDRRRAGMRRRSEGRAARSDPDWDDPSGERPESDGLAEWTALIGAAYYPTLRWGGRW